MFGRLALLRDLPAIIALVKKGELLEAAAIVARYTETPDDDKVVELVKELVASNDPGVWLANVLEIAKIAVKYTETTVDDEVLDMVDAIMDDPVFEKLVAWLRGFFDVDKVGSSPDADAIPIPLIISLASLVLNLLRTFRERRGQ